MHAFFLIGEILMDGVVEENEILLLGAALLSLGVRLDDLPKQQVDTLRVANEFISLSKRLRSGRTAGPGQRSVIAGGEGRFNLLPEEVVHAQVKVRMLDERVVGREFVAGGQGFSFRIMPGVSYRFGGTRGHSVPVTGVVSVDAGTLSFTSKRVLYVGAKKSFAKSWAKVLGATPLENGLHLACEGRPNAVTFEYASSPEPELYAAIISH